MNILTRQTSPHYVGSNSTGRLMSRVLLALVPGIIALIWFFGWGVVVNIVLSVVTVTLCETAAVLMRRRSPGFYLSDCSALVTALLLAIALPPYAPWWLLVTANASAILLGKHIYGGLGYNPFNPAMIGYVVVLISFPVQMTTWGAPLGAAAGYTPPQLLDALKLCFGIETAATVDALTMATPLDLVRTAGLTYTELKNEYPQFGVLGGLGWEWVNIGFLLGGLWLLQQRVFSWHAPVGMLGALTLLTILFYSPDSNATGSPLFQLFSGATMLGCFFIVTDPVSGATSPRGRLIFGIGVGSTLFVLRTWSNYPDAVAFAVLLMNFAAPLIDYYTLPRTYGHRN